MPSCRWCPPICSARAGARSPPFTALQCCPQHAFGRLADRTIPLSCASGTRPSPPIRQPCSQHTPVDPYRQATTPVPASRVLARAHPPVQPHHPRTPHPPLPCFRTRPSPHLHLEHLSPGRPRPPRYIDSVNVVQRPTLNNGIRDSLMCRGPKEDAILNNKLRTAEICIYYSVKVEADGFDGGKESRGTGARETSFGGAG